MRRTRIIIVFCILMATFALPGIVGAADKGSIVFCKNFNDKWEPQGAGSSFEGSLVSWIAKSDESYGVQQLFLSIYEKKGSEEALFKREPIEVRPAWNTTGMRNMALPGKGDFLLSLEKQDGTILSEGKVTILSASQGDTAKNVKTETLGANLADLFNKYLPKTK